MSRSLSVLTASAVAVVVSSFATQASAQTRFYDSSGGFRGYAWCHKAGIDIVDCNYFNLAQCQATNLGFGPAYCVPNPFMPAGPAAQPRRRKHRS